MKNVVIAAAIAVLSLSPAFAQSETKPEAATSAEPKSAPAEIRPASAPVATAPQPSGSFQGFGLIQNGNAMLGIRPRQ